jgi:probable phosphomutase (TIGR03848 family)
MATVLLVRHGRSTANTAGVLAGRARGVHLDERGVEQARHAAERLADVRLVAVVSSPLERCRETAKALVSGRPDPVPVRVDRGLTECDYGEWQGRPLKELAREKLWKTVQSQPAAAGFPGGETLAAMQARVVAAVRRHDAAVEAEHGAGAVWVAVSHGDLIKAVLADALGSHLDHFQRIHVDPASISVVRYTESRPYVLGTNTHEGSLAWLNPPQRSARRSRTAGTARRGRTSDAAVGGGAGPG